MVPFKNLAACLLCLGVLSLSAVTYAQERRASAPGEYLSLSLGLEDDGTVTPEWRRALHIWHDDDALSGVLRAAHPLSAEEALWVDLIRSKIPSWSHATDSLGIPFQEITPPHTVYILLGNVGGQDAFTYSDSSIGFDVNRLHYLYGEASKFENSDRIDRFFAHEYTHILHKAWRNEHGLELDSLLEVALWECLTEGLGNYRSLSGKWTADGELTPHAIEVLARLQPVFVERISALEQATEDEAATLMDGLSSGPFDQKWGALTVALWLAQEARGDDRRLQQWVEAGPWGIVALAHMYLPEDLGSRMPQRP